VSKELILNVLPETVNVPVVNEACRGRSLSLSSRFKLLLSLLDVLFLEEISVLVAKDSTLISNLPVNAPVNTVAVKPEF
jgi:hypothetical protein